MRQFLLKAFTILCCSQALPLANQATLGSTEVATSQKSQETTKSKAGSHPASKPASPPQRDRVKSGGKASETVLSFFKQEGEKRFGITDPQKEIRILRVERDPNFPDRRIARVQQLIRGIPVFGARATLVLKPGKSVVRVTSDLTPTREVADVKTIPTINWLEAVERAVNHYRQLFVVPSMPSRIATQLLVFEQARVGLKPGVARLAWMVRLGTFVMFMDAHDGSVIFKYSDVQSDRDRKTYDLNGEDTGGHGVLVLDEKGPIDGVQVPHDANMAHAAAAKVYAFFNDLGRDSYDDGGGPLVSNVRASIPDSKAMWHPYGGTYDGPQVHGGSYYGQQVPDAIDIVGHEFTHGVIRAILDLLPDDAGPGFGEPGAINEAFADYFGAQIEGTHNWKIGESLSDGPLRDMENPHNGGFDPKEPPWPKDSEQPNTGQPDHYTEKVTMADDICGYSSWAESQNDCPHLNNGIFNKVTYLASVGGSHHGVDVKGIKSEKFTRILYAALLELNPFPKDAAMSTTAQVIATSCMDLVGLYKISKADCTQVKKAFEAVGLPVP